MCVDVLTWKYRHIRPQQRPPMLVMFEIVITACRNRLFTTIDQDELSKCILLAKISRHDMIDNIKSIWRHSTLFAALHSLLILIQKNCYAEHFECPYTAEDDHDVVAQYVKDRPWFGIELRNWDLEETVESNYSIHFDYISVWTDPAYVLQDIHEYLGLVMDLDVETTSSNTYALTGLSREHSEILAHALQSAFSSSITNLSIRTV